VLSGFTRSPSKINLTVFMSIPRRSPKDSRYLLLLPILYGIFSCQQQATLKAAKIMSGGTHKRLLFHTYSASITGFTFHKYLGAIIEKSALECTRKRLHKGAYSCLANPFQSDGDQLDEVEMSNAFQSVFNEIKYKVAKEDQDRLHTNLLTRCRNINNSTSSRTDFEFKVQCGGGNHLSRMIDIPTCRSCFQCAYQISSDRIDIISRSIRENVSSGAIGTTLLPTARKLNSTSSVKYSYG
jgi:hypothetical protein